MKKYISDDTLRSVLVTTMVCTITFFTLRSIDISLRKLSNNITELENGLEEIARSI